MRRLDVLRRLNPRREYDRLPDAEAAFIAALHREDEEKRQARFAPVS
jgi:hypothetical protein